MLVHRSIHAGRSGGPGLSGVRPPMRSRQWPSAATSNTSNANLVGRVLVPFEHAHFRRRSVHPLPPRARGDARPHVHHSEPVRLCPAARNPQQDASTTSPPPFAIDRKCPSPTTRLSLLHFVTKIRQGGPSVHYQGTKFTGETPTSTSPGLVPPTWLNSPRRHPISINCSRAESLKSP